MLAIFAKKLNFDTVSVSDSGSTRSRATGVSVEAPCNFASTESHSPFRRSGSGPSVVAVDVVHASGFL